MIPEPGLCDLPVPGHQELRVDAARGWWRLNDAYVSEFQTPLCITDSYRSLAGQQRLAASKPGLAATPGTSNHGWALALDLCGGVEQFGSPQHEWMRQRAPDLGWVLPDWASEAGSRPEAWHWEWGDVS